jgi:5'-nucleotidase
VSHRPLILLSNDDGHRAKGIQTLAVALRKIADVVVCAPETEQSTTSHSLTLTRPLRLRQVEDAEFAVDGTPADCVYVALNAGTRVLPRAPDLVVSGMNHGLNLGTDVFYSGTVAAAREGALRGIPAMATSADMNADPGQAAEVAARLALALVELAPVSPSRKTLASTSFQLRVPAPLINVNVPPGNGWPVVATRLGLRLYEDLVEFRRDPRGREYLWIGGGGVHHEDLAGSDTEAYDRGAVSVTPLLLDLTAAEGTVLAQRLAVAASRGSP